VVKSRLQAGSANALKYKSSLDGLLTIIKEEGVEGLYKGIGSKIVQSVLTAAILFAGQRRIFEVTKAVCAAISVYRKLYLNAECIQFIGPKSCYQGLTVKKN
jgi:adenine nucleotide transporter 17